MDTLRATAWLAAIRFMRASPFFREFCCFDAAKMNGEAEVLLRINGSISNGAEVRAV